MGVIADAVVSYAQPLIDDTDGSIEQMNKAMALSQACWNIAILPKEEQDVAMLSLGEALSMNEVEFNDFRSNILLPMIRRHEKMFPGFNQRPFSTPPEGQGRRSPPPAAMSPAMPQSKKSSEPGRYDPCPCNSGKKYKFCCGRPSAR